MKFRKVVAYIAKLSVPCWNGTFFNVTEVFSTERESGDGNYKPKEVYVQMAPGIYEVHHFYSDDFHQRFWNFLNENIDKEPPKIEILVKD